MLSELEKVAFLSEIGKRLGGLVNHPHFAPAVDLAGLGALATPTIYHRATGKEMSQGATDALELGGLGAIAAGPALHFLRTLRKPLPGSLHPDINPSEFYQP